MSEYSYCIITKLAHQVKEVGLNSMCIYLVHHCLLLNSVILEVIVNVQDQNREILQVLKIKPEGEGGGGTKKQKQQC